MARAYFESKQAQLLRHHYISSKDVSYQRRFRGIIRSNSHPGSSAWLYAIPNDGFHQRMTPLEFQSAACLRLLIPQFTQGFQCQQRTCNAEMDPYGYHALICRGHFLPRHNTVRDALFNLMLYGGFDPKKDAPVTCLGVHPDRPSALRPADILMAGDDFDRDCVDVTVVSPIRTTQQEIVVGDTAQKAEDMKIEKHAAACEAAGFGFKPFAVDIFGVIAKESSLLLKRVCEKMIRETCCAPYKAIAICQRRISLAVQLGVARQLIASRKVVDPPPVAT